MLEIAIFCVLSLVGVSIMYWHTDCHYSAMGYFNQVVYRVSTKRLQQINNDEEITAQYPDPSIISKHTWRKFFFRDYKHLYKDCNISLGGIV